VGVTLAMELKSTAPCDNLPHDKAPELMSYGRRHFFGMRRALASLLLVLFSLSLIGPVLLADTDSNLPSCCRRDGKHGCGMKSMGKQQETSSGPKLRADARRCAYFPKAEAFPAFSKIALTASTGMIG